ncbi:MAG: M23 family metallopeptidase [Cyclobacteriaceae bacterium]
MARIKYYYDTETCRYERVKTTAGDIVFNVLGVLSLSLALAVGLLFVYSSYFESPKELILKNELQEMEFYYNSLSTKVDQLSRMAEEMAVRDDNIYRSVLGSEPLDPAVRNAGIGGSERYVEFKNKKFAGKEKILEITKSVDQLRRKLYIESKSQDEVVELAREKEKLFSAIPAIRPLRSDEISHLASGYGMRIHPVYKVRRMHPGIDFSAPVGTPIYATADGVIQKVEFSFSGYGKMIDIDHGFGYMTRYAHMHGFAVRKGQRIKRGELIGYVGNTGLSTGPHLHYEVHINGKVVNPVYYFFNDLNAEDYENILKLAAVENMSLGGMD